jgi:YggT family protein
MDFVLFLAINIIRIYKFAILARVLISWIRVNRASPIVVFIYQLTEPPLRLFRGLLPNFGMIDLSPLIAFFALDFLQLFLMSLLDT